MKFVYTVWFRDPQLPPEDQDHEWPACFVVDALTEEDARSWGDHLASHYAQRTGQGFLTASIESFATSQLPGVGELPVVRFGQAALDNEIGW